MEKYTRSSSKLVRVYYQHAARHEFLAVFLACCYDYGSDQMPEHESNEFEDEINEIIEKRKTVFCPIINSMCRIDCEAFEMPEVKVVREAPPAHYYMSGGICTHFLLRKRDLVEIDSTW